MLQLEDAIQRSVTKGPRVHRTRGNICTRFCASEKRDAKAEFLVHGKSIIDKQLAAEVPKVQTSVRLAISVA